MEGRAGPEHERDWEQETSYRMALPESKPFPGSQGNAARKVQKASGQHTPGKCKM